MPTTLTDEQVAELRRRLSQEETNRQIAEAAATVWNHPEEGARAKEIWKKVFPDSQIPEFDLEQRVNARFAQEKEERERTEKERRDREQDERIAAKRKETQDAFNYTDDEMKRLEELMVERNIGDYEVAATYMGSRNPRVSDGTAEYDSGFWNHEKQDIFKEIVADPEAYGRREILKTLREQDRKTRGEWR